MANYWTGFIVGISLAVLLFFLIASLILQCVRESGKPSEDIRQDGDAGSDVGAEKSHPYGDFKNDQNADRGDQHGDRTEAQQNGSR